MRGKIPRTALADCVDMNSTSGDPAQWWKLRKARQGQIPGTLNLATGTRAEVSAKAASQGSGS